MTITLPGIPGRAMRLVAVWVLVCQTLPAQTDVLTGGYGNSRSNANLAETALTPATVAGPSFGKIFSLAVDGQIYAQPLYMRGVAIPNHGLHNVVFIATMHNTVYAFDADAPGLPLWSTNLGPAVPAAYYDSDNGPYTDIILENGILGTPVINAATGTLFAVAATLRNRSYVYRLHALDITSGEERFGAPSLISASLPGFGDSSENGIVSFQAQHHLQRPALLLFHGAIYLAFGAHGDAPPYHGWILAYSANDVSRRLAVFNSTPNGSGGAFWQSGRGLSADDAGAIYAVSSNGDTDGTANFSDSVLKLNAADLTLIDWFAPSNVQTLNDTDDDLGSAGAIILPGTSNLIVGGKEGAVYLLSGNSLGHQASAGSPVVPTFQASNFGLFNVALWARSGGPVLYTHGANENIRSWKLFDSGFTGQPLSESLLSFDIPFQGMTISASGGSAGTGILWVTQPLSNLHPEEGHLVAYDASDLSRVLWDSAASSDDTMGKFTKFANPTVANGKVFVPTISRTLAVYGLTASDTDLPVVTALANAASYEGGAVAPGEIVVVRGENLGPADLVAGSFDSLNQLPAQLATTQVFFNGIAAPLLYASSTAVAAIVPFELAGTPAAGIQVSSDGHFSAAQTVPVVGALPGVFSADSSGVGPGAILNEDYSLNSPDNPAKTGSVAIVYATGGGAGGSARTGARASGADPLTAPVTATVNGVIAEVLYGGAAPTLVYGVIQVNVRLPLAVSGDLPIVLTISGHSSPATVTVSVK